MDPLAPHTSRQQARRTGTAFFPGSAGGPLEPETGRLGAGQRHTLHRPPRQHRLAVYCEGLRRFIRAALRAGLPPLGPTNL